MRSAGGILNKLPQPTLASRLVNARSQTRTEAAC